MCCWLSRSTGGTGKLEEVWGSPGISAAGYGLSIEPFGKQGCLSHPILAAPFPGSALESTGRAERWGGAQELCSSVGAVGTVGCRDCTHSECEVASQRGRTALLSVTRDMRGWCVGVLQEQGTSCRMRVGTTGSGGQLYGSRDGDGPTCPTATPSEGCGVMGAAPPQISG